LVSCAQLKRTLSVMIDFVNKDDVVAEDMIYNS
jgi:hypothetical protein